MEPFPIAIAILILTAIAIVTDHAFVIIIIAQREKALNYRQYLPFTGRFEPTNMIPVDVTLTVFASTFNLRHIKYGPFPISRILS